MKTTIRKILPLASEKDTWLAPYVGYKLQIRHLKSGKITARIHDRILDVTGYLKYFSKPLSK